MGNKIQLSQEVIDGILDCYCNKKWGLIKTGKANGVSDYIVRRVLLEHNIHIRSFSEAATISNQIRRKFEVNDNYFDVQSPNMAYLLGFLAADGTVSKDNNRIKIGLSAVDTDFLEQLRAELQVEKPLLTYETDNGFQVSELIFSSATIKQRLKEYNIVPGKTYTFTFPEKLEKQYYSDFIRGYFDGDGSVSTAGASAIRFQICSYRKQPLQAMIDYFTECGVHPVSILEQKRNGNTLYYFQYSATAVRQIFEIIYKPNCLCLPRKFIKYKALI